MSKFLFHFYGRRYFSIQEVKYTATVLHMMSGYITMDPHIKATHIISKQTKLYHAKIMRLLFIHAYSTIYQLVASSLKLMVLNLSILFAFLIIAGIPGMVVQFSSTAVDLSYNIGFAQQIHT